MSDYWNDPIPRKMAMAVVVGQGAAQLYILAQHTKKTKAAIEDREQIITILKETCLFLTEHADDRTCVELNKNLDYWRVVRGISTADEDQS